MFKPLLATAAISAAAFALPSAANAATQVDVGPEGLTPGETVTCDFETAATCAGGFTGGTSGRYTSDQGGVAVMQNGTAFYAVLKNTAVLSLAGLNWRNFSFDWGTIDGYNSVTLNFAGGGSETFTSSIFGAIPGNANRRVAFSSSKVIQSVGFTSTQRSFEFDNIAGSVPEPGTWLLMILGLGAVGFSMRRRQTTSTRFQFA